MAHQWQQQFGEQQWVGQQQYEAAGPSSAVAFASSSGPAGLEACWGSAALAPQAAGRGGGEEYGRLRSVDDLPQAFRPVFQGSFRYFNAVQSESFAEVVESPMNVVLAAPTGSGKTVVMELAVLQLLSRNIDSAGAYHHAPGCLKVVYLAPARALVQEKTREWSERFGKALGVVVKEVTGDTDITDLDGLDATDIICTTPEKFDAMTRRHRANGGMRFFNEIALVLIDEVHLLAENRGSSLEAGVISRIKMVSQLREMRESPIAKVRFVAVSATIPNIKDIANWLGAPPQGTKVFGEEMRPVKLRTIVRGYNPTKTDFLFERRLNDHISGVVADFSKGRPTLVFCSSRKGASETAQHMAKEAVQRASGGRPSVYIQDVAHHRRLMQAAAEVKNAQLKECIKAGVGVHHAAMEPAERALVERLFLSMDIMVLCTTSTLAMGVNLPAHLVVVKGTRRYLGSEAEGSSGYQEYERSTCLQMVGRAGRPQFDTEGVAVIMTHKQHVPRYEQLVRGSETVESALKDMLPEFLNAEIALRTITDVSMAVEWLKGTFFYTRVRRNPAHYNVPQQVMQSEEALDRWVKERLLLTTIQKLARHGLVRTDGDGFMLEPLQPGILMAGHYIRLRTMALMAEAPSCATIPDLINIVARSTELSNIKLRRSEKKQLNEINHSDAARYHLMHASKPGKVMERISSADHKIFILVNAALSDQQVDKLEYSLRQEIEQIVSVGSRIAGCMIKYFTHVQRASETFNSYLLHKNFKQRMWTDSQFETRQVPGIGPLISERLAAAGICKLRQLAEVDPRRLESITQRHYPFGNEVHDALRSRLPPVMELQIKSVGRKGAVVELEVTAVRVEGTGNPSAKSRACLLVGTLPNNELLACRALCLEAFPSPMTLRLKASLPKGSVAPLSVVASVVHERLVGVDVAVSATIPLSGMLTRGLGHPQQTGRAPATPNAVPADEPAEGTLETEGANGSTLCEEPGNDKPLAAGPFLPGPSAAAPASSEAQQYMSLQQMLRQQQAKALGAPKLASPKPVQGLDHAAIGSSGLAAGPLGISGPRPAAALRLPAASAAAETTRHAAPLTQTTALTDAARMPKRLEARPAGSRWDSFRRQQQPAPAAAAAAPMPTVHLQQWLPLPPHQPHQQESEALPRGEDFAAIQPGQLFSQFRCSKPGSTQRPKQAALLGKLSTRMQGLSAPGAAAAFSGGRHVAEDTLPSATVGELPQKRKLLPPLGPGEAQKENRAAPARMAEDASAAAPAASFCAPAAGVPAAVPLAQPATQPPADASPGCQAPAVQRGTFKIPKLAFLSSRWNKRADASDADPSELVRAAEPATRAAAPVAGVLPEVDFSQCFSFL